MKLKNNIKFLLYSLSLILTVVYILYRLFFTIPTTTGILSIIFGILILLIEFWEAFDFFIYYFNILTVKKKSLKIPDISDITDFPDIDILIATYNENESLLRNTITACLNLNYPDKNKIHIYLCDDGNRSTMKNLAKELNINYISRLTNRNAKAGNYNHALQNLTSPYVATFDADMAPCPNFLMTTLPFFLKSKEKIGFVQLPQSFKNPDIFQYRYKLENYIPFEQDYFYHTLQIAKNETNSAVCCGTNTLFSRQALNDCNGFATGSLSEDIATGMLIENEGYKCIALPNIEAYGKSVNDLDGFLKQRSRWARGCVQMLKKYKITSLKGLSLRQKLEYLSCVSYWFFGFRRLVYLIAPLLFSIFGIIVVDCNIWVFLSIWLPTYLSKRYVLDKLEGNKRSSTWNKIYETILTPVLSGEVIKEFLGFSKDKFEVTPKSSLSKKMSPGNKKLLISHLILLILNIVGFSMSIARIYDASIYNYILSFVWTTSNIFYLFFALYFDVSTSTREVKNFVPNKVKKYSPKATIVAILGGGK